MKRRSFSMPFPGTAGFRRMVERAFAEGFASLTGREGTRGGRARGRRGAEEVQPAREVGGTEWMLREREDSLA